MVWADEGSRGPWTLLEDFQLDFKTMVEILSSFRNNTSKKYSVWDMNGRLWAKTSLLNLSVVMISFGSKPTPSTWAISLGTLPTTMPEVCWSSFHFLGIKPIQG